MNNNVLYFLSRHIHVDDKNELSKMLQNTFGKEGLGHSIFSNLHNRLVSNACGGNIKTIFELPSTPSSSLEYLSNLIEQIMLDCLIMTILSIKYASVVSELNALLEYSDYDYESDWIVRQNKTKASLKSRIEGYIETIEENWKRCVTVA